MKTRTCPNCGYKYPLRIYYTKFIFRFVDSRWDCVKCNSLLTFNFGRRLLVILIAMLPVIAWSLFSPDWNLHLYIPGWLSYILLGVVTLSWAMFVSGFDTFSLVEKGQRP